LVGGLLGFAFGLLPTLMAAQDALPDGSGNNAQSGKPTVIGNMAAFHLVYGACRQQGGQAMFVSSTLG
jgi:hypothetical protein